MGKTYIANNIKKTSDRLDRNGNIINPITKEVIKSVEPEFTPQVQVSVPLADSTATNVPPFTPQAPITQDKPKDDGLSVLSQIEATKARLKELEELKKLKIAEKEAELELLKQ